MSVEEAILHTIHSSGLIVRSGHEHDPKSDTGEKHRVESINPLSGERFIVVAPTLLAAATELAIKLGFDLEE